jgi:hypothetical protein
MPEAAFLPSVEMKDTLADVAPPPPFDLSLEIDNLAVDDFVRMTVTGAEPGENVVFLRGTGEGEFALDSFGITTDITNPTLAFLGSSEVAGADGVAELYYGLPANEDLVGRRVYMQAVVMSPEVKHSNVIVSEVTAGAACIPDVFEDNNTLETARAIPAGDWENLSICADLEDWYVIAVNEGDFVDLAVQFADDEGDIDIQAYNQRGDFLASSVSVDDDELIENVIADYNGDMYLRVYMYRDEGLTQQGNVYDMQVARVPGEVRFCEPDGFEDNDTPADATDLSGAGLISGGGVTDVFAGLSSCEDDGPSNYDVYSVDLLAGESLSVLLEFSDSNGDLDVTLLDLSGGTLDTGTSVTDNEFVTHVATFDETVLVRVQLFSDEGAEIVNGNEYDMNITVGVGAVFDARLTGSGYDMHEGQELAAALVDLSTGLPIAGDSVVVSGGAIEFAFPNSMEPAGSYEWHIWADHDGSTACEAPPVDHTWLVDAGQAEGNLLTTYDHGTDFVDACATFE